MVRGKKGLSAVGIAVVLVIIIAGLATWWFWPKAAEPLKMQVAVQGGKVAAGGELALQVSIDSKTPRDVTLVAELFNTAKQLVNIVRDRVSVTKGNAVSVLRMKVPAALPPGRYNAVITARYDKTQMLTQETLVRVVEEEQAPITILPVNVTTPPTPLKNVTAPVENVSTPPPTPPAPAVNPPPSTPGTHPVVATPEPLQDTSQQGIEMDNVADVAKSDKDKALAFCDTLTGTDQTLCVSKVAIALVDMTICSRLPTTFDQDKCYLSMASSGNADACLSVQDSALQATCQAVAKFYNPAPEGSQ